MQKLENEFVSDVSYIEFKDYVKLVVAVKEASRYAVLTMGKNSYPEAFNYKEPFDLLTHVFNIPSDKFVCGKHTLTFKRTGSDCTEWFPKGGTEGSCYVISSELQRLKYHDCINQYDSEIDIPEEPAEREVLEGNVIYSKYETENRFNEPIVYYTLEIDPKYATFVTGTPDDGYVSGGVKQTVKEEALAAVKNGRNVIAATNADFFDIFGDLRPAGLCVKNGRVVDNEDSDRPFLAVKKDGSFMITSLEETPDILADCENAVSGGQIVMKNGRLSDVCVLEPFGYTKHPRTAAGIRPDGSLILLIVDGRITEYSNGATLVDVAIILKRMGAEVAINLDGGGSSTMIVKNKSNEEFEVRNIPADLYRPYDRLIRDLYDSILIVAK